jgi:peptide/nickel transport system permease protein
METIRMIFKRIVLLSTVVVIATFLLSLLMRLLPGDPAAVLVPNAPEELRALIREETGLSKGIFGYYWQWLSGMLQGDFGKYYLNGGYRPVSEVLKQCLPPSLFLILYAQIVALAFAIPLGLISAYKENSRFVLSHPELSCLSSLLCSSAGLTQSDMSRHLVTLANISN